MSKAKQAALYETFSDDRLINRSFVYVGEHVEEYDVTNLANVRNVCRFVDEADVYWIEGEIQYDGVWKFYKSAARANVAEVRDHIVALGKAFGTRARAMHVYNQSLTPLAVGNLVKIVGDRAYDEVVHAWAAKA